MSGPANRQTGMSTGRRDIESRMERLRSLLSNRELDGVLVTQPYNIRYLTGFTGGEGWLVVTQERAQFATDSRYFEQVEREAPGVELVRLQSPVKESLIKFLESIPAKRLGFEAEHMTVGFSNRFLRNDESHEWVPTSGMVLGLRAVKEPEEVEAIRVAIRVAEDAFKASVPRVVPGKTTERELAWWLEKEMRERGAEKLAFDTIVAAGPNGAMAHAVPGGTPIPPGVPVVIDMGAQVDGYCSDFTRTVCWGKPEDPERFWEVYNTVLKAQENAIAKLRPGMNGREGDALARDIIARAGYGHAFGHSLGHGVGLQVHELPRLSASADDSTLKPGMVVTVEPGIYLRAWGGVRIEDMGLVAEHGLELLTSLPKEPLIP